MSRREQQRQMYEVTNELTEQLVDGTVTFEQLQERFRKIELPEKDVIKLSPEESFTVNSGALRVTDPCYDMDTWCAGTQEGVKNGQWVAFVGTAHDETDLKWSKKRLEEGINELVAPVLDKEDEALLKDVAEEKRPRVTMRMALMRKLDALRSLVGSELFYGDDPIGRVYYLHIHHKDHPIKDMDDTWEKSEIHVGVDSGQAGFVDLDWFKANQVPEGKDKRRDPDWDKFYDLFRNKTLETKHSFGCLEHAAVSSTGWGDGGYNMFLKRDEDGQVIAARIIYLGDEPGEEEGEEE